MSHDTQVKQGAPERIYTHPTSAEANVNPWPLEPGEYVEYVRADLLATVRREEREAAQKVGRQALAAELLGHLDRIISTTAAYHFVRNICKIELGQEPDSLGAEIDH